LKGKVPYEAWYGRKPDVSHLRIFGSLGWAHVPKEVQVGKIESQAVQIRMLGWWADETKGYRLEDLEKGVLITSRDVQFDEDDSPSNVASFDMGITHSSPEDIIDLTNSVVEEQNPQSIEATFSSSTPKIPSIGESPIVPATPIQELDIPIKTISKCSAKKWEDLPKCELSTCEHKQTKRYGEAGVAFIATIDPTYDEAMASPEAESWQNAIDVEYGQLVRKGVIEEIEDLLDGK
jgi:hypothetical protein